MNLCWALLQCLARHLLFCLSLHFLLAWILMVSHRWKHRVFSGFFWACVQPWACVWPSRCPSINGEVFKVFILYLLPQASSFQDFPSVSACPDCSPLPQVATASIFTFTCFQQTPPREVASTLRKFQGRRNKGEPLSLFSREPQDRSKHTAQFFERKVHIAPSGTRKFLQKCRSLSLWLPSSWEVGICKCVT